MGQKKPHIPNKVEKALASGIPKELFELIKVSGPQLMKQFNLDDERNILPTTLNYGIRLYKWNYFTTKFRIPQFGEHFLLRLIDKNAIDPYTLCWCNTDMPDKYSYDVYAVATLYGLLIYFWDNKYLNVRKSELPGIAHEVFNVQPSKDILKEARDNKWALELLREWGYSE